MVYHTQTRALECAQHHHRYLLLAYGLNILFGFEPGKIIKYYNPRYEDLKHFVYIIIALLVLIFIVLFTLISMKRNSINKKI